MYYRPRGRNPVGIEDKMACSSYIEGPVYLCPLVSPLGEGRVRVLGAMIDSHKN